MKTGRRPAIASGVKNLLACWSHESGCPAEPFIGKDRRLCGTVSSVTVFAWANIAKIVFFVIVLAISVMPSLSFGSYV